MLLASFLKQGVEALAPLYPQEEARSMMLMLCAEIIGTKSYTHIVEPQYEIDKKGEEPLARALARLETGEPIQYVLGKADSADAPSTSPLPSSSPARRPSSL